MWAQCSKMNRPETQLVKNMQGALLRTLIDCLPDIIYVKDIQGRKIIANRADVLSSGAISEQEVLGKTDLELYSGEIGMRGYLDDMAVIETGTPLLDREEFFYDAQGARQWLLTSKVPVRNNNGVITHLIGIGHDITQRKQSEESLKVAYEQIKASNETLRHMSWSHSHEMRRPVCSILSLVNLLKNTTDEADHEICLGFLETCANELDDVIHRNNDKLNSLSKD